MSKDDLSIQARTEQDAVVMDVRGEVNLRTSPTLHNELLRLVEQQPKRLIVNLAGVEYMDSSGVGTLIETKRRIDRYQGRLVLASLQPRVMGVFEITQLQRFFIIAKDVQQAMQA
jgi:anti-sigma B factor antagonist